LRGAVNAQPFDTSAGALAITFSAGIAHYRKGDSISGLLHRADGALYRAKARGRDRVEVAAELPSTRQ
jgi:diguanylate cyclase